MKIIMYHYVRNFSKDFPYFQYLSLSSFKRQLDFFEDEFGFVSKDDFEISLKNKTPINGIILTFDDGFRDHFNYVFPELLKRKLWGIFYVSTSPIVDNNILDVHRIHLLLGKYGGNEIFKTLKSFITDDMLVDRDVPEFSSKTYLKQDNLYSTTMVKRILNYFIDYKYRKIVLDKLMEIYFPNERSLSKKFYLKTDDLKIMTTNGMVIGSHSVNHPVMSKLNKTDQGFEIKSSFETLKPFIDKKLKSFCFPYGGFHSFNNKTINILEENNCVFSMNVESRDVKTSDFEKPIHVFPRYDCNEFPYGSVDQ